MKKFYTAIIAIFFYSLASAQNDLTVVSGTDLYISSGNMLSSAGLSLTPSSGFTLNGLSLSRSATVSHTLSDTYVSRVYQFSTNSTGFSGVIGFIYDDAELNGLNESNLGVKINNGSTWQNTTTASRDNVNNYIQSNTVSSLVLNELVLVDILITLPLKWGPVNAQRLNQTVNIEWTTYSEKNVDHFEIERSTDLITWVTISRQIPATNTDLAHQYTQTDNQYLSTRLFYRIRQADADGRYTYSSIASVNEEKEMNNPLVYPNPSVSSFAISKIDLSKISTVQLFDNNGALVKTWYGAQSRYPLQGIARGIYSVKLIMSDGSWRHLRLQKQ